MPVDSVDPNSIFSLATCSTIVAFAAFSTFISLIMKNAFYLSMLRDALLFYQSIIFYIQLDSFLLASQATFVEFFKYFFLLNGELNRILFNDILGSDSSVNGTEFWSFHSFFLPKVGLFFIGVLLWELSFGWLSYLFCIIMRERNNILRSLFNYLRFCFFSVFYVWLFFPLCSVIVRPLFFPEAFPAPNSYWNIIYISMAGVSLIYILCKLMIFWMDIFVHWIHIGQYQRYVNNTRKLRNHNLYTLSREYYQVKKHGKKNGKRSASHRATTTRHSHPQLMIHSTSDADDANPASAILYGSRRKGDDVSLMGTTPVAETEEFATGIPTSIKGKTFPSVEGTNAAAGTTTTTTTRRKRKSRARVNKRNSTASSLLPPNCSPLSIIIEPICAVVIVLRSIFFRPSIVLKLFVERYENLRNISLPKLPKQNLNSAFGAAIRNYREGDDALFEVDYVLLRIILWTIANGATTFFVRNLSNDGEKYRVITMTAYQGLFLLYYMLHMANKHWYQRLSTIFFNFLTLGVMTCFLVLTVKPDISNQEVIHWVVYACFVVALLVLMLLWVCSTCWRCIRCCTKKRRKRSSDTSEDSDENVTDVVYLPIGNGEVVGVRTDSDQELESHHDMVEVLTGDEVEDDKLSDAIYQRETASGADGLDSIGSRQRASSGFGQVNATSMAASTGTTPDDRRLELSKINTTIVMSPKDNNYMISDHQHVQQNAEDEETFEESDESEDLESIATNDSVVLDFEKINYRHSRRSILMTPQDEDLRPAGAEFSAISGRSGDDDDEEESV